MLAIAIAALSLVSAQSIDAALESAIESINRDAVSYFNAHSTEAGAESVIVSYGADIAKLLSTRSGYGEYYSALTQRLGALTDASAVGAFITQGQQQDAELSATGASSGSASASASGSSSGPASKTSASSSAPAASSSGSGSGSSSGHSSAASVSSNGAFQVDAGLSVAAGFVGAFLL